MNKQELIETLEELKENAKRSIEIDKYEDYWRGKTEAYVNLIGLAKQLNEPQKPVVPQFVADWFEENKDDLDNAIFGYLVFWEERDTDSVLYQWFAKSENNPIENLIRMKDGYEVEKEPLYYVPLPFEVWDEETAELKKEFLYLAYDRTSDETRFFTTKAPRRGFSTKLDEITIKSVDEKYWAFAVPVEEVAEG